MYIQPSGVVLAFCGIYWYDHWYSCRVRPVRDQRPRFLEGEEGNVLLKPFEIDLAEQESVVRLLSGIIGSVEGFELADTDTDVGSESEGSVGI